MGQLVWLADDEILERQTRIERCRRIFVIDDVGCADFARDGRQDWLPVGDAPFAASAERIDDKRNAAHLVVLRTPQREQAIAVMGGYPIAQKAGGYGDDPLAAGDPLHGHRSEPGAVCRLPDLSPHPAQDPVPIAGRCLRRRTNRT